MDDGRIGDEMTLEGIAKQLAEIRSDIKSLDHKMKIEFEETTRVVKLGFENLQMLDEKIDRRFDGTDRAHADNKSLLEVAVASLRRDTERRKRPATRR